jgi:C-terminal processing protease CtpA/Prc
MERFCLRGLALLMAYTASAQVLSPPAIGVALVGGDDSCPVFVLHVGSGSPAEEAGIKSGDVLVAVDGTSVTTLGDAVKLLHSETETPVTLKLVRGEKPYTVDVRREKPSTLLEKSGYKILDGHMVVPLDATETEMKDKMQALTQDRFADRVFPTHYPSNEKLYYPGFEVLILKKPPQVAVLGIEDGPAARAGIHWGDIILSVNEVDPRNKSVAELERLFSSERPTTMTLKIEREGVTKTFVIELAQATQVLRDNQRQLLHGKLVPLGLPDKYLPCFD